MSNERRHVLIVNPSSGGGRGAKLLPEAERLLGEHGLGFRTVTTTSLDHGVSEARSAATAGEVPVVMSGDGMIGQIGGALAGGDVPMGILPGGRGNDFARVVRIPTDLPAAVELLTSRAERSIDVGEVNGRRFLCIASLGFDSDANRIANEAKLVRGNLVYAYAALRALAAWKPGRFAVTVDGEAETVTGFSVAVGNSRAYGGGMFITPQAELDDGKLDVVTTGDVGKLRFLANLPKVFKGEHIDNDEVRMRRGEVVEISADRDFAIYADGEHLADLPARVTVLPGALRIIAPAGPLADPGS